MNRRRGIDGGLEQFTRNAQRGRKENNGRLGYQSRVEGIWGDEGQFHKQFRPSFMSRSYGMNSCLIATSTPPGQTISQVDWSIRKEHLLVVCVYMTLGTISKF